MTPRLASHWKSTDSLVTCRLCPHACRIPPGKTGLCGVRLNQGGELTVPFYAKTSSLAIDPIEKKPLYHFLPGSRVLSVGFLGCNLRCPFCQNYTISQSTTRQTQLIEPDELVSRAESSGTPVIAYTYNEPTIHYEFVRDAARLARAAGMKNVLVTNGHLLPTAAKELAELVDAMNIDLKTFKAERYTNDLGGDLKTVKNFIQIAAEHCHVEVTTLLVPGFNDSPQEIREIVSFLANINSELPFHISAYYPAYLHSEPATPPEKVLQAVELARSKLSHVYAGNVSGSNDTRCSACGAVLVSRRGYTISTIGLKESTCKSCGAASPIVVA